MQTYTLSEAPLEMRDINHPSHHGDRATVTAPSLPVKSWARALPGELVFDGQPVTHLLGAWYIIRHQGRCRLEFGGNHQDVPVLPCGKTAGRALRHGRRALARLALPVK